MSSIAQSARGISLRRGRRASRAPSLLGGGVLWIVLLAGLLAGVVAVNVAVLRLNVQLDRTGQERSQLKADVAGLRAELSRRAATAEIEQLATGELGLVKADPESMIYVQIRAR
jgi:cell division protein FtsL